MLEFEGDKMNVVFTITSIVALFLAENIRHTFGNVWNLKFGSFGQGLSLFIVYHLIKSNNDEFVYFFIVSYVLFWGFGFSKCLSSYTNAEISQKGVSLMICSQWITMSVCAQLIPLFLQFCSSEDILMFFGLFNIALSLFVQIVCVDFDNSESK